MVSAFRACCETSGEQILSAVVAHSSGQPSGMILDRGTKRSRLEGDKRGQHSLDQHSCYRSCCLDRILSALVVSAIDAGNRDVTDRTGNANCHSGSRDEHEQRIGPTVMRMWRYHS